MNVTKVFGGLVVVLLMVSVSGFAGGTGEIPKGVRPGQNLNVEFAVVPQSLDNPVFFATKAGAMAAAEELGVKLVYTAPVESEPGKQATLVEQLLARGEAGILVSVMQEESMAPIFKKAYEKGVSLVTFDSDSPKSKRNIYYGSPNYEMGQTVARYLVKAINGKGKVIVDQWVVGHPNIDERYNGIMNVLGQYPDIQVVAHVVVPRAELGLDMEAVESTVAAHPEANGLCSTTGAPWFGSTTSMPTLRKRALDGSLKCVGTDPIPACQKYVEEGILYAAIGQRFYSMGYDGIKLLAALALSKTLKDYTYDKPLIISSGLDILTKNGGPGEISIADYKKMWAQWEASAKR